MEEKTKQQNRDTTMRRIQLYYGMRDNDGKDKWYICQDIIPYACITKENRNTYKVDKTGKRFNSLREAAESMEEKTKYRKALDELLDDLDVRFSLTLNHLADEFGSQILRILAGREKHPPCISTDHHKILIKMFITICDETIHKRPDKEAEAWFWKGMCQLWLEDSDAANSLDKADEFFQAEREWRENS